MRRVAIASLVGTTLEYYDFAVYNSLAAIVFNQIFFPSFAPLSGTLLAFSTFAVGYLARPVGGLLFGRLGDMRGRRVVLMATLVVMGVATSLMGLLPSYAMAGILSPGLLVMLRFVQGAAVGGEWAGAVLLSMEHGASDQRGLNASWANAGPSLGTLLATASIAGLTVSLSADSFVSWGWRVPFLVSVALVGFGLWIRAGVDESPVFKQLQVHRSMTQAPIGEVFRGYWRRLLIAGGSRVGSDVMYSLLVAFTLTYLTTVLHQSRALALLAVSIGGAVNCVSIPLFGSLSDRFGRRPVYGWGVLLAMGWGLLYFGLLNSLNQVLIVLAIVGGFLIHAMMYGPQAAFITEQFPTRVRFTGSSLAYTLVGILAGGLAPVIFAALYRSYGTTVSLSLYLTAALCVTGVALLAARETSRLSLEQT